MELELRVEEPFGPGDMYFRIDEVQPLGPPFAEYTRYQTAWVNTDKDPGGVQRVIEATVRAWKANLPTPFFVRALPRRVRLAVLAVLLVGATGCATETPLGPCVGLLTEAKRDSTLVYEYHTGNIIVAVVLSETLIVPAIIVAKHLECPVKKR
jgi:hypothetical protein